jgi:hypothetical protein
LPCGWGLPAGVGLFFVMRGRSSVRAPRNAAF